MITKNKSNKSFEGYFCKIKILNDAGKKTLTQKISIVAPYSNDI